MAHLYAYCDESGKQNDHQVVVFTALVDNMDRWMTFGNNWRQLLRRHELPSFHAVEALQYWKAYGAMKPGTAAKRAADVAPFVGAVVEGLEFGAHPAIDVGASTTPRCHR